MHFVISLYGQVLEPNAARHLQLDQLINKSVPAPKSITVAKHNVDRALFLFRIRRCPPIPLVYLQHSAFILKGKKNALWGLLWEIKQAYPAVAVGQSMRSDLESGVVDEEVLLTAPSMKVVVPKNNSPDSVSKWGTPTSDPQKMYSKSKHRDSCSDEKSMDASSLFVSRRKKERAICEVSFFITLNGL